MGNSNSGPTPQQQVQEWGKNLRKEGYQLDRQIRAIQREEEKIKRSLKEAAKKGDKDVCIILAKEVINSRKAVNRIYSTKAQLNSIQLQMKQQLATVKVAGSLEKSTEVMKAMSALVKVPEIAATMRDMSKEMMKAGIIEEMLEDTFESMEDADDMEEEAAEQIDNILWEITAGQIGKAPETVSDKLPAAEGITADKESDEDDLEDMKSRLQALTS